MVKSRLKETNPFENISDPSLLRILREHRRFLKRRGIIFVRVYPKADEYGLAGESTLELSCKIESRF